jgi:hypothetical protein
LSFINAIKKIEQAIIDNMEHFLLKMGKGFALVTQETTDTYTVGRLLCGLGVL